MNHLCFIQLHQAQTTPPNIHIFGSVQYSLAYVENEGNSKPTSATIVSCASLRHDRTKGDDLCSILGQTHHDNLMCPNADILLILALLEIYLINRMW